jgi:hypothetical protein
MLEFMVLDMNYTLENRSVIFRVRIDFGLDGEVCFSFIHVTLHIDNFLKDREDIAFSIFYRIKKQMAFPNPTNIFKKLLFIDMLRLFFLFSEFSLLEVTNNNRGQQFIHTLFIRHLRVSSAPNE